MFANFQPIFCHLSLILANSKIVNYLFDEDLMNGDDLYRRKKLVINESIISMLVKILYKIGESKGLLFYVLNDLIEF